MHTQKNDHHTYDSDTPMINFQERKRNAHIARNKNKQHNKRTEQHPNKRYHASTNRQETCSSRKSTKAHHTISWLEQTVMLSQGIPTTNKTLKKRATNTPANNNNTKTSNAKYKYSKSKKLRLIISRNRPRPKCAISLSEYKALELPKMNTPDLIEYG